MSAVVTAPELKHIERAQLHRETYIATLNGLLTTHGSKRLFAQKLDISPQYLSYILDPWGHHVPSNSLATKIAQYAPADFPERLELVYHIANARITTREANHSNRDNFLDDITIQEVLGIADELQRKAVNSGTPVEAHQAYRSLLKIGKWALARIKPQWSPNNYAGILVFLHDAANALNLPVTALWYAKSCIHVCENPDLWPTPMTEGYTWLRLNSLRMLSASYHNLNLPQQALDMAIKAASHTERYASPKIARRAAPHLARDLLNAYAIMPRFSINDAETVAQRCLDFMGCGSGSAPTSNGLATLVQRSLIDVYIQHGSRRSLKKAQHQLEDKFYNANIGNLGVLTSILHLRTRGTLNRVMGDQSAYEVNLQNAYQLAQMAGLIHQLTEIQHEIRRFIA